MRIRMHITKGEFEMPNEQLRANVERNNGIITDFASELSRESFIKGVRLAVRSQNPEIADCLISKLEYGVGYRGASLYTMSRWTEETDALYGRERRLSTAQVGRLKFVLDKCCPRTAQGNYLPPYTV